MLDVEPKDLYLANNYSPYLKSWHMSSCVSLLYVQQMVWSTCREEDEHKVFLPFIGDIYSRSTIESKGSLKVVTTTQVSEESV